MFWQLQGLVMGGFSPKCSSHPLSTARNTESANYGAVCGCVGVCVCVVPGVSQPHKTAKEWRKVFFITSGVFLTAALVYTALTSTERQRWAEGEIFHDDDEDDDDERGNGGAESSPALN
eukprot:scpid95944/ scgid20101/ 